MLHSCSGAGISVGPAPAMQTLWCEYIESDGYLYNLCTGYYQCYDELKTTIVLICVETKWPGSLFTMAVLGCRFTYTITIVIAFNWSYS